MKKIAFLLAILFIFQLSHAQEKTIAALKITQDIKIDGKLAEESWQKASNAEDFILNSPEFGAIPKQKTIVKILYSDQAVYIGAYLYDQPDSIRRQLTPRDGEQRQDIDFFAVFFDTYNDDQNGFQFLVTSRNVQSDGRIIPNRNSQFGLPVDYSWDAVWESKVTLAKDGWIVEMKIPYAALRFAKKEVQDWGINFQRYVRRSNESGFWNKVDPNQNGFVNQFGQLTGLQNIVPPLRLSFLPYITAGVRNVPTATGTKNSFLRNGGMDVKYGINESFTLDATLIPDFGQVISDNVILNLSPFEVQFQENRPFFTEGTELFNKSGMFYSRRVGATPSKYYAIYRQVASNPNLSLISNSGVAQLYNATKFSGRNKKKLGIGVFNALAAPAYAVIENNTTKERTRIETEPLTNYNILVLDQALKNRSSITFTNTNVTRSGGERNANVSALDVSLFDKTNKFNVTFLNRVSAISGTNPYNGFASYTSFQKVSGKVQFYVSQNIESDKYDINDLGFLRAANKVTTSGRISYNQFTPTKNFLSYSYTVSFRREFLYKPYVYNNVRLDARMFWFFKNFWDLSVNFSVQPAWMHDYFELRTSGRMMKKTSFGFVGINGSTDSRKKLFARINLGFAESPIPRDPFFVTGGGIRYRFSDRFSLDIDVRREEDNGQFGYAFAREANGDPIVARRDVVSFTSLINGIYNFTPRMNLTLRARHYWSKVTNESFFNIDTEGVWNDKPRAFINGLDQNYNAYNLDMFYTWDFMYGSRLIVGYKNWLGDDFQVNGTSHKNYTNNLRQVFTQPLGNELTVRLIYFLDYLTLRKKRA